MDIQYHTPVMTKDGELLGLAQRILRSTNSEIEVSPYNEHLKVFNFEMGDAFFVPLNFVSADGGKVTLSLTFQGVLNGAFSNMPRYIAYDDFEATELAQ
jgi:hypothetical protein